jgi:predicted RNA methylase
MARRNSHGISWQTIRLEGSLLLPDLLEQIAKNEASHQKESEYQIPAGLRMIEEIGRSYQIARALHADFKNRRQSSNTDAFQLTDTFFMKFMSSCLGWTDYQRVRSKRVGDYGYPVQKIAFERIPITVAAYDMGLDTSDSRFGVSGAKVRNRSLFQMSQEYLNALGKSSWGVVSNGSVIRLLRSSPTMARPQYLEFDLYSMLEDDHYSEYTLLWKILHVSRVFDVETQIAMTIWEEWRNETISTGERVRDGLRTGVTKALMLLGSGFIANPANEVLRQNLNDGKLTAEDLYHQLLRLVYRFLFLFALEERRAENGLRLVFIPDASLAKERDLYEKGYSLDRLREVMIHRSSYNYYTDLWAAQKIVFTSLAKGEKRLALPALGGLFSSGMCDDLDSATMDNATFLKAMESLRWANNTAGQYSYIDYKNMGTEELGSVYESLLELVPTVDMPAKIFRFIGVEDDESTAGNARKTTGSYYTPSFLVDQLVKTALVPVLEKTAKEHVQDKAEALLSLSVIDPACGSGHFILAAARKIAEYVAVARDDDGVVTPSEYRRALRDVISRCVYGVDLNPMAVELTKMALWLEGYEPGKPLSFLDRHLLCGNSLLGVFDLTVLDKGIPKDAFKQLTGDDKEYCANLAKQNAIGLKSYKQELEVPEQTNIILSGRNEDIFGQVDSMPEESVTDVEQKAREYHKYREEIESKEDYIASDIFIGAFLMQKRPGKVVPTSQTLYRYKILQQPSETDQKAIKEAREACKKANVLHWPFAFPKVFTKGGFDVVLGNPPWDVSQVKDTEYFAKKDPSIAALDGDRRKKRIGKLETENPVLFGQFVEFMYEIQAQNNYLGNSGRYPLSAHGKLNYYPLFCEVFINLQSKGKGRIGALVPTGIATDDSTKQLFSSFIEKGHLVSLYDFENQGIFPSVHNSYKFCLLTLGSSPSADFACFQHSIQELEDDRRHFELTAEDFDLINPNTHTLPIFRSKMDAELAKKIYRKVPVLIDESKGEDGNPWGVQFSTMFNMTTASNLFLDKPEADSYPLYEAKMLHQYDHRWATYEPDGTVRDVTLEEKMNPDYEVTPRYWVPKREVLNRIADVPDPVRKAWYAGEEHQLRIALTACGDEELNQLATADNLKQKMDQVIDQRSPKWLMGWRDITNTTNERTVIASLFPRSGVGNTINMILGVPDEYKFFLIGNLTSTVLDYCARQKVGGTHLNQFYFKQLPILQPTKFNKNLIILINQYVGELVSTTHRMASTFPEDISLWDDGRRAVSRAELDALYARLYGLNREELLYILDPESVRGKDYPSQTFPGLKNKEIREYGEYRTMRLVLEAWDRQERQPELWQ